jgi:shikimate 5-dehydrogenase
VRAERRGRLSITWPARTGLSPLLTEPTAKAEALASAYDRPITITNDLDKALSGAGLVINATSLGMAGKPALEPHLTATRNDALVFDMVYTPLAHALAQSRRSGRPAHGRRADHADRSGAAKL